MCSAECAWFGKSGLERTDGVIFGADEAAETVEVLSELYALIPDDVECAVGLFIPLTVAKSRVVGSPGDMGSVA